MHTFASFSRAAGSNNTTSERMNSRNGPSAAQCGRRAALLCAAVVLLSVFASAAAVDACPFVCPDSTCARSLANCSCVSNAVLTNVDALFDSFMGMRRRLDKAINAIAFATYGVTSGNCSDFDFTPYLQFQWELLNESTSLFNSTGADLLIPPLTMHGAQLFILNVAVQGLLAETRVVKRFNLFSSSVATEYSIGWNGGADMRISNERTTIIPTFISEDPFPSTSSPPTTGFSWSCANLDFEACQPLSAALGNGTMSGLTIEANTPPGTYPIQFYLAYSSKKLNLVIVAGAIPDVRVIETSAPITPFPSMYLSTQTINLASSVNWTGGPVTYAWAVNGVAAGSNKSLSIPAASLSASSDWDLHTKSPVLNVVTLRVTSTADATVFGDADSLAFTASSNISTGAPFGDLSYRYVFGYYADKLRPLTVVPTSTWSNTTYVVRAPMPYGGNSNMTFVAMLQVNGVVATAVNVTFGVVRPNEAQALQDLTTQAAAITDPTAAVAAALRMKELMGSATNQTQARELAAAAVAMLARTMTDFGGQSAEQQAAVFETLSAAVAVQTDAAQKQAMQGKVLQMMTLALSSPSFSPANGAAALTALVAGGAQASRSAITTLANVMAKDPSQAVGEARTLTADGVVMTVVKQSASGLGGLALAGGQSTLKMATGFTLPGVAVDAVVGVASVSFTSNPFGGDGGKSPDGAVVSFEISVDGATAPVSGLSTPLSIELRGRPTSSSVCKFWDTSASSWSTTGVTTAVVSGVLTCQTTHLTAFGSFTSSAAGVAASLLVAALALVLQLTAA